MTPLLYMKVGAAALALSLVFYAGYQFADNSWSAKWAEVQVANEELKRKNAELEARGEKVTTVTVTKYVDRVKEVIRWRDRLNDLPPITPADDSACVIPPSFVSRHNKAANGPDETKVP